MKLENKVAIVTGGTSGIGKAAALRFGSEGAKVVISGRNIERGNSVAEEIQKNGGEACFIQADMSKPEDMDTLLEKIIEKYGKLDILFNNAGISDAVPLDEFTDERWDAVMDTNLKAPFQLARKAMPYLLKTKGNILNTASVAGIRATRMAYAYGASKSGLIMLTKVLALDYAEAGIRVNAVCPGVTETPLLGTVRDDALTALKETIPMKRLAEPDEIINAVVFLVSDDASYITGQALCVDGGFTL
ncbi:Glucose 1-dehydrogenase [Methanimicrococcus sp. At1]|uniref:Glucose 1-dehydrogenase n=1 Tax=Methanimicrococcus hacksteinii TaxID=3028293 RepID=A0ABU3VQR6_9EURY|nr:glucose 1-dehydrogenase [Methanimicrococcus sp. At1]MDV0445655.1 Glucose 1-dehydrogenase [Methanimicrococcus sp. At1]